MSEAPDARRRRERAREQAEALGLHRFSIFVPAVMSVGLVFWLLSELRELLSSQRARQQDKRARLAALRVADRLTGSSEGAAMATRALRPRPVYLILALALLGGAAYVSIGAIANYGREGGYVHNIGWLLALSLGASGVALLYGAVALLVFIRYPRPPWRVTRLFEASPLSVAPSAETGELHPSWVLTTTFVVLVFGATLLAAIVGWSPHVVRAFDEQWGDWFAGRPGAGLLPWIEPLTGPVAAVAVAAFAGMAAIRCRTLVSGYVGAMLAGLAVSTTVRTWVAHPRPAGGALSGSSGSFPSGHVLQATLIAGLVPIVVAVVVGTKTVIRPLRLVLAVVVAMTAIDRVGAELDWPTDVLGAVLFGVAIVVGVDWILANGRSHERCRNCPWSSEPLPSHPRIMHLHTHGAAVLRAAAHLSAAAATLGISYLTLRGDIPTNPEATPFGQSVERPAQLVLAGLVSIGGLVAWKWPAPGAVVLAFAASGLGIFASVEYEPSWAVALTSALLVPAVLNWLVWQPHRTGREIVVVGAVTFGLLGATWAGATTVYDHYYGPTHPDSAAAPIAVDRVEWIWAGGLDSRGVTVTARLATDGRRAVLVARSTTGEEHRSAVAAAGEHRIVRLRLDGLTPDTAYDLQVEVDAVLDRGRGFTHVHTPAEGAFSFRVAVASCARTMSNGAVFDEIRRQDPLLFLQIGDLHYRNLPSTSPGPFLEAFDQVLTRPGVAAFARAIPWAYVWDDHDYGDNDADSSSPTRTAARAAFRTAVPDFGVAPGDAPINQAFTIGRVRFVMTDNRSERTDESMLGEAQTQWLIDEVTAASRTHALVVWANPSPWVGAPSATSDTWSRYDRDRRRIADAFATAGVQNLVMVSGDAHMVAIDDGTNTDYSTDRVGGFPLLQAAPLDRPGSVKGGPYTSPTFTGGGQFGLVDVIDDGGATIRVTLAGHTWDGRTLVTLDRTFAVPAGAALAPPVR